MFPSKDLNSNRIWGWINMKLLYLSNVYLIITSAFSVGYVGILFHFSEEGENSGVNYLHDWNILL